MTSRAPAATKGEQTRQSILTAAIERFGRDGFRASSVADIARDAGVGGTLAYAYFDNKEDLFLAALDDDVAAVINEGMSTMFADTSESPANQAWRETLIFSLIEAVDGHPLARRVLAGLEPNVTGRMIQLPALAQLRAAIADRLRQDQASGRVRHDIDPVAIASGSVTIYISLLMSLVQFGLEGISIYGPDVMALIAAAIEPPDLR